jgi:hypothetical protein
MTKSTCSRLSSWLLAGVCAGCTQSPIDLIHAVEGDDAGAEAGPAPWMGNGSERCAATLGEPSPIVPTVVQIRQQSSGRCLAQGAATTIGDNPAFEITLADCAAQAAQRFALMDAGPGIFEMRNVATNLNVDIQFAETADGTPAVLYAPHQLYNQRFRFISLSVGNAIAPRHVMGKCLSERGTRVEIWPCTPGDATQRWEILVPLCE